MSSQRDLGDIPRGRTCRGVHKLIVQYLLELGDDFGSKRVLDIPCGGGELLATLRRFFPKAALKGADLTPPSEPPLDQWAQVDASRPFSIFPEGTFNLVISVSGVLEFDNTLTFLETLHQHLEPGGTLIVTDDNVMSIRDRLEFFFLGKVRHPYDIFVTPDQPSWKVIPIHNLVRNLEDAGFKVKDVRYVPIIPKDFLLLPLALVVFPIQMLYIHLSKTAMPLGKRRMMYPFAQLLSRHYLIIAERLPK